MNTTKPVSTISYNSLDFLQATLKYLLEEDVIEYYAFIKHSGEYDSVLQKKDKDHIHLLLFPNRCVNTKTLQESFVEPVKDNDKPLGCMPFRSSSVDDWFLYNLHDVMYLRSKFEEKEFHYSPEDFVSNDDGFTIQLIKEAYHGKRMEGFNLLRKLDSGLSVSELAYFGFCPPQQAFYYQNFETLYNKGAHIFAEKTRKNINKEGD